MLYSDVVAYLCKAQEKTTKIVCTLTPCLRANDTKIITTNTAERDKRKQKKKKKKKQKKERGMEEVEVVEKKKIEVYRMCDYLKRSV